MFGFFKSATSEVKVIDKIWMSCQAKWNACATMTQVNPNCLFIAWFEETHVELQKYLTPSMVILAKNVNTTATQGRMILFAEHHPLSKVEQELFSRLNLREAPVLSALDEPLFQYFGGERTIEIMKKLGMGDNEIIGHSFINKAIRNAQRKIAKQVITERKATSQQEWFSLNLKQTQTL